MILDMADIKPTVYSLLIVTMMAAVGIVFFKFIFNRWPVAGLTDFWNAV